MTIKRVIQEANAPGPIYFLLTAYIEATRFYIRQHDEFSRLMHLPLGGINDIRNRLDGLHLHLLVGDPLQDKDGPHNDIIAEAIDVFATALDRLQSLNQEEQCQLANIDV